MYSSNGHSLEGSDVVPRSLDERNSKDSITVVRILVTESPEVAGDQPGIKQPKQNPDIIAGRVHTAEIWQDKFGTKPMFDQWIDGVGHDAVNYGVILPESSEGPEVPTRYGGESGGGTEVLENSQFKRECPYTEMNFDGRNTDGGIFVRSGSEECCNWKEWMRREDEHLGKIFRHHAAERRSRRHRLVYDPDAEVDLVTDAPDDLGMVGCYLHFLDMGLGNQHVIKTVASRIGDSPEYSKFRGTNFGISGDLREEFGGFIGRSRSLQG
ncbi:hypothetical protein B0H14DRAFT_2641388 [Mycena olivaceomarginata]|nr:hypothetical protein B0H14DRAFT_2641388 [Mycena olivaceomarginata]